MSLVRENILKLCHFPNNRSYKHENGTSCDNDNYSHVKRHRVPQQEDEDEDKDDDAVTIDVATISDIEPSGTNSATAAVVDHPSLVYNEAFDLDDSRRNVPRKGKEVAITPGGFEWQNWRRKRGIAFIGIGFIILLATDIWLFATILPITTNENWTNNSTNYTASTLTFTNTTTTTNKKNTTTNSSDANSSIEPWGRCGFQFLSNLSTVCLEEIIPCYMHNQCQNYSTSYNNSNSSSTWNNTNRILSRSRKPTNVTILLTEAKNTVDFLCLAHCV
jgi:hypothetical protein